MIAALLKVAAGLGYRVEERRLASRDAGGVFVRILPDGRPVIVLTHPEHLTTVRLIPERWYRRAGGLRSVSYEQRPDVALKVECPGGPPRLYLFNPKYKLDGEFIEGEAKDGRPKKVDADKMHAYRDAIRDGTGRRVVQLAAIMYPGPGVQYGQGIEALPATPGEEHHVLARLFDHLGRALT